MRSTVLATRRGTNRSLAATAVSVWLVCILLTYLWPSYASWSSIGVVLLALVAQNRVLIMSFFAGAIVAVFGAAGAVSYLGVIEIQAETVATAIRFYLFAAGGAYFLGRTQSVSDSKNKAITSRLSNTIGLIALGLLILRFATSGIPLLLGDSARLIGVAQMNPYLGLLSGIVPIIYAYLPAEKTRSTPLIQFAVVLAVLGTGSRLLFLAVMIGIATQYLRENKAKFSSRRALWTLALIAVSTTLVILVYSLRTDSHIAYVMASRVEGVGGWQGLVIAVIGPSLFLSARNGLVVHELLNSMSLSPPGGFLLGGLRATVSGEQDPERWLTQALGLDLGTVGAVATPLWSGTSNDVGNYLPIFALLIGAVLGFWARSMPQFQWWIAFGVILSSYGSYLVSSQFIFASIGMLAILALFGKRSNLHLGPQ